MARLWPSPAAGDAAPGDADLRLDGLVARVLRVLPRVEEAEQAAPAVGLERGGHGGEDAADGEGEHQRLELDAADEQHHEHDRRRG